MPASAAVTDAAIEEANAAARATPTDAGAWLALISLLQEAGRFDDEGRALRDAARHLPDHPQITLAAGISAFRHGKYDLAQRTLTRAAELEPESPTPWVALARVAEMKGNLVLTLRHTLHAVKLDPRQAQVLANVGHGLKSVGRKDEAERAYRGAVAGWRVLATLLSQHGRTAEALEVLQRALELAPQSSDLHALAGDILRVGNYPEDAAKAYASALQFDPKSADVLNKLGCLRQQLGDVANAERMLQHAIALDPAHMARENLVSLYIEQNRFADARTLLQEALSVPSLADEARGQARATLAILDERDRLAPVVARAVAEGDDELLAEAVNRTSSAALALDDAKLAAFADLAQKARGPMCARENERFERGSPGWTGWPAFEAHFALHRGDSPEAVLGSRALLEAAMANPDAGHPAIARTLQRYVRAIALRRSLPPAGQTGAAREARLRFWHAAVSDPADSFAGQVKPSVNYVSTNPTVARTRPAAVAGTLRRFLSEHYGRAPPGPWRAALLYFAIVDMHGFRDGNGRLARFVMNARSSKPQAIIRLCIPTALSARSRRRCLACGIWTIFCLWSISLPAQARTPPRLSPRCRRTTRDTGSRKLPPAPPSARRQRMDSRAERPTQVMPTQVTLLSTLPCLVVGARAAAHHGIGPTDDTAPWDLWAVAPSQPTALRLTAGGALAYPKPIDGHAVLQFDVGAAPVRVRVMRADSPGAMFVADNADGSPLRTPAGDVPGARLSSLLLVTRAGLLDPRDWWLRMQEYRRLRARVKEGSLTATEAAAHRALSREVEANLPPVHRTSMRATNAAFFDEFRHDDIRLYEHDDLHHATCYYREPLYESAKDDRTLAYIPRGNFERMSLLDRGRLVREECHAIALERVVIPSRALGVACDPARAYLYALHRIRTDLATGWFRDFAIEYFDQLADPDIDFAGRFEHATGTGAVRPRGDGTVGAGQRRALQDCLARVAERLQLAGLPGIA